MAGVSAIIIFNYILLFGLNSLFWQTFVYNMDDIFSLQWVVFPNYYERFPTFKTMLDTEHKNSKFQDLFVMSL